MAKKKRPAKKKPAKKKPAKKKLAKKKLAKKKLAKKKPVKKKPAQRKTTVKQTKESGLALPYFAASIEETSLEDNGETCSFCGAAGALDEYSVKEQIQGSAWVAAGQPREGQVCLDCIRAGRVEYLHKVEWGELTATGVQGNSVRFPYILKGHDKEAVAAGERLLAKIPASAVKELRRTPPFRAWQGAEWLIHCDDFMCFIGVWGQDEFATHSKDPERLYQEMLGDRLDLEYGELFGPHSEVTLYAFRCRHCDRLRGYIDGA